MLFYVQSEIAWSQSIGIFQPVTNQKVGNICNQNLHYEHKKLQNEQFEHYLHESVKVEHCNRGHQKGGQCH